MIFNLASSAILPSIALLLANSGSFAAAQSIYQLTTDNGWTILKAAVDAAGLDGVLSGAGTFTVFAPTDDAFGALDQAVLAKLLQPEWKNHLADIILYHALSTEVLSTDLVDGPVETLNGESITVDLENLTIGGATIATPNVDATNGVVHVINSVLLPNSVTQDIVGIASAIDDLSTLGSLADLAELIDDLQGVGPFTVFAPNNAAFAALPAAEVEDLQKTENKETLVDVILYHVVSGIYNVGDFTEPETDLTALNGDVLHVELGAHDHRRRKLSEEEVTINGAHIVATYYANNGIIHVVDKVIEHDHSHSSASSMKNFMGITLAMVGAFIML